MILAVVALISAVTLLASAAYFAIDRAWLPMLCLGAIASVAGAVSLIAAVSIGLPAIVALLISIPAGSALGWVLVPLARILKPMAFAGVTLTMAVCSLLIPNPVEVTSTQLDWLIVAGGLLFAIASIVLVWRFDKTLLSLGMSIADNDARLAMALGAKPDARLTPLLTLAGGLAALGGCLLHLNGTIVERSFGLELSFALLAIVGVGGRGAFRLILLAAIPIILLPQLGILMIPGFPDFMLAMSVLGIVLVWLVSGADRGSFIVRPSVD